MTKPWSEIHHKKDDPKSEPATGAWAGSRAAPERRSHKGVVVINVRCTEEGCEYCPDDVLERALTELHIKVYK